MSTLTVALIICLFILIVLSGFLSGSETALTATSKPRILLKFKKGNKKAGYVLKILNNLDNVISSLLLSNNLVNILASSLATAVLYDLFGVSGIFYATLIMTILIVIFAEILPKTYSLNRPTRTSLLISPIIYYLSKILYPIIFLINLIVKNIFLRNQKNDNKIKDEQSEEELQGVIDMYKTSSPDSEHEKDMLQSILTLNDTTVEEVFTHRKNIYSIDGSLDISEIIKKINIGQYGPVIKEYSDNSSIKPRFVSIKDIDIKSLTLEEAMEMLKYPYKIGEYNDMDIYIDKGRYGLYVKYNKKNYSIPDLDESNIDCDSVIEVIKIKMNSNSGVIREINDKISIYNGPYGPYIKYNKKTNYKIMFDKSYSDSDKKEYIDKLSVDDCNKIINNQKSKKGKNKK